MSVWKVILATFVIFSTGAITGTLVARKASPVTSDAVGQQGSTNRPSQSFRPDRRMRRDFMERFGEELALTDDQSAEIESILSQSQERTRELWEQVAPKMRDEFKATQDAIHGVLTPEQQARFEELMKKRRRGDRDKEHEGPPPKDGPEACKPDDGCQITVAGLVCEDAARCQ